MVKGNFSKNEIQKLNRLGAKGVRSSSVPDSDAFNFSMEKKAALTKQASDMSAGFGGAGGGGVSESARVPLLYVDPMFDPILLMFPKENIKELNRRLRHYYTYHPIVRNAIDLHSEYPLSDFELRCEDKSIEAYYNDFKDKIGLLKLMTSMNRDYWLLGEAFCYGNWDVTNFEWDSFNQYPPENIDVFRTYIGKDVVYYLKADDELKRILNSPKEVDRAIASSIPSEFTNHVRQGRPFLLAGERVLHFARRPTEYALRGESIVKSALKDLMYEDKLRLLQYTFVDRHTFPIKHWKVGSAEKGWIPSPKHFKALEIQLTQAMNDPDFNLITHPFVQADFKTTVDMKEDLVAQFDFVHKRLMMALFINDGMMSGDSTPFATQAVSMKLIMHRYLTNRTLLENIIKEKVFLPIAQHRKFIKRTPAELNHKIRTSTKYIVPKFFYTQKLNLLNNSAEQEMLIRLRDKMEIPMEIISDVFGWDLELIKKAFEKEQHTSLDPVWRAAREEASKDVRIRNQILDGTPLEKVTLYDDIVTEKKSPGRPAVPDDKKSKAVPSVVPMGTGDASSRSKGVDKGTIPEPKTTEAPAAAAPAEGAPGAIK